MGLRINQNIGAQKALFYVRNNDISFERSMERLSSGLRIVRGADDPAGLVMSEKFRAQVEGIGQAISNSKDGISMVQTAEGSLDEVSSILRQMRNVALHAANTGPNDSAALAADQQQISEAIDTLNRIANTTRFGTRKLLDGSSGVTATSSDNDVVFVSGSENTEACTYAVAISTAASQGQVESASGRSVAQFEAANAGAGALDGTATLTIDGALAGGAAINISLAALDDLAAIKAKINLDSTVQAQGLSADAVGGKLQVTSSHLSGGGNAELAVTIAAGTSTNEAAVSGISGAEVTGTDDASATSLVRNGETLTFSNGSSSVTVAVSAGQTLSSAVSQINSTLDNAGIKVTAAFDAANHVVTLTNDEYGSSSTVSNTFQSSLSGAATNMGLPTTLNTSYNIAGAASAGLGGSDGDDMAGTIGTYNATGSGQFLTGDDATPVEGLKLRIAGGVSGSQGTVTTTNGTLQFQIGAFAAETVSLAVSDVRADRLGTEASGVTYMSTVSVSALDVSAGSGAGAQDALRVLDSAMSQVSTLRAKIGSFQKDVLESTVRNLGVARQNMAASESNIRDADFAEEMLSFSRSQILAQTGMSMLTQANQSAQGVLSLFR